MDGDDLHQMLVAFQPHLLAGGVAVRFGDMLRQPAHQRMFALQLVRRLLQELADMQNIGQASLAAVGRQQIFSDAPRAHQRAQHRHDAPLPPELPVAAKLLNQLIPRPFVVIEIFDIQRVKTKHRRRQRAAQRIFALGSQHRL